MSEGDVLVVGAGPTGLTAAVELARREVGFRIVDAEPEPVQESRALVTQPRTLEVWLDQGIAEAAFDRGIPLSAFRVRPEGRGPVRIPVEGMGGPFDQPLTIPQDVTEALLVERLEELGATVERPVELEALELTEDGPEASLSTPEGTETCSPSWVLGADGAHSTVRHELDLPFEGVPYPDRFAIADADLTTDLERGEIHAWLYDGRLLLVAPLREPGHHRIITTHLPEDPGDPDQPPTHEEIQALVDRVADVEIAVHEPRWTSVFRVHCRGVPEYRVGPVCLAGDAAHIHSPAGGQGMNTGIQDAHNLAWKLALVHHGHADPGLLDSYHAERHPVGQRLLATTDRLFQLAASGHRAARLFRKWLAPTLLGSDTVRERLNRFISQRNIRYRDSPLNGPDQADAGPFSRGSGPRVGDQAPDAPVEGPEGEDRLLEVFAGHTRHVGLVFAGPADPVLARELTEELETAPLVSRAWIVADEPGEAAIGDPGGDVRKAYARDTAGYEVVRPDGHLAVRSGRLALDAWQAYLHRIES